MSIPRTIDLDVEDQQQAASRYTLNRGGRKERDGFLCGKVTGSSYFFCVAVKIDGEGVSVRDTKDASDNTLHFNHKEWGAFVQSVKAGEFDI